MNCEVKICTWKNDAPFAYSMTYDEGTLDAIANALPVHEEFGFPGHVDVVAGQLGIARDCYRSSLNDYIHMSSYELKYLLDKGWGVGNHSWSHYNYPTQPGLNLFREVVWSKYRLEDMIEYPVRIFTIPNDTHNYEPVIDLVKEHYLACANIENSPNREDFDLYKIGNYMVASGEIYPRPGWVEELKTKNLSLDFLKDSWLYETSHLVMWNVPQSHKCVTPEYLTQRFIRLNEVAGGKLWAAKPDDVIDYVLFRRNLKLTNIHLENDGSLTFDVEGEWPVGLINSLLTLRVSGLNSQGSPTVEQEGPGAYGIEYGVESMVKEGSDWLITLQLAPKRTVRLIPNE